MIQKWTTLASWPTLHISRDSSQFGHLPKKLWWMFSPKTVTLGLLWVLAGLHVLYWLNIVRYYCYFLFSLFWSILNNNFSLVHVLCMLYYVSKIDVVMLHCETHKCIDHNFIALDSICWFFFLIFNCVDEFCCWKKSSGALKIEFTHFENNKISNL